jgi:hypothetical protein
MTPIADPHRRDELFGNVSDAWSAVNNAYGERVHPGQPVPLSR